MAHVTATDAQTGALPTADSASHEPGHSCGDGSNIDVSPHQHAFFVVGTEQLFLVHMGNLGMVPHRFQLVLRIAVPEQVRQQLLKLRSQMPNSFFIIGNTSDQAFALASLAQGSTQKFKASLWHDIPAPPFKNEHWPWDNQAPLVADFQVQIQHVVYYRPVDFNQEYPRTASYLLFGAGKEAHLHHIVTRIPDYDHVVNLSGTPDWLPAPLLEAGILVNFPHTPARPQGQDVYSSNPLAQGRQMVQVGGVGPHLLLELAQTVFFGIKPLNP